MDTMRKRSVLVALALLGASCQNTGPAVRAEPGGAGWRVLERLGEAHLRAPAAGEWAAILAGDEIPPASTLVTGTGGRLILARSGGQLVVGPNSRLRLAGAGQKVALEQSEGRVRYRIGKALAFAVATPALDVRARDAVLEVSIGTRRTTVTVEAGEAKVATFDGRSVGVVAAGGSARAGAPGEAGLMVRSGPAQSYQRVEPVLTSRRQPVLEPAIEPDPIVVEEAAPGPVVPAGFVRPSEAEAKGADASDPSNDSRTPEREGRGVPALDAPDDPFAGFTDGLLGSLSAIGPDAR